MLVEISPIFLQRPGDDRELAVEQPPEGDGREHGRHDERDQHDRADHRLERHVLVEQEREIEPDREFEHAGDAGIEQRVEHREQEHRVVRQPLVVLEPDEDAGPADARVGERQPDAEPERIGEKQNQERRRRQHEPEAEPVAVDLQAIPRGRLRGAPFGRTRLERKSAMPVRTSCMQAGESRESAGDGACAIPRRRDALHPTSAVQPLRLALGDLASPPWRPRGRCRRWRTCRAR